MKIFDLPAKLFHVSAAIECKFSESNVGFEPEMESFFKMMCNFELSLVDCCHVLL